MKFCQICKNMLYGNIQDESNENIVSEGGELVGGRGVVGQSKRLYFSCKNCGYAEAEGMATSVPVMVKRFDNDSKESPLDDKCISQTNYFDDIRSFQQYQTINIKHDMTLPRVKNIECPKCTEKKKDESTRLPEVICIKYDQANMKYLYFCCHCEHFWKLETL